MVMRSGRLDGIGIVRMWEGGMSVCLSLHAPIDVCIGKLPNVMNELDKTPRRLYIFTFTSIDRLSYVLLLRQATGTDLL